MKLVTYYDTHAYYFITDDVALYIERRRSNTFLFRIVAGTIGSSRSVGIMGEYTYRKDLIKKRICSQKCLKKYSNSNIQQ